MRRESSASVTSKVCPGRGARRARVSSKPASCPPRSPEHLLGLGRGPASLGVEPCAAYRLLVLVQHPRSVTHYHLVQQAAERPPCTRREERRTRVSTSCAPACLPASLPPCLPASLPPCLLL